MRALPRDARGKPELRRLAHRGAVVIAMFVALGVLAGVASADENQLSGSWGGPIDPNALHILKGMSDYLGGLQQFSMHTENTYEDVLETGQKIQFGFATDIVVQRPNKMRAERTEGTEQMLYIYDGAELFMHQAQADYFAAVDVPETIDGFLHFARDTLDLVPPAGDMVFANAFELLTAGVTSGFVVGKTIISGVSCYHLAFTTPVVDWQVWIAEGDRPLPYRYVLTTRDDPAQPQFVTMISNWSTAPKIDGGTFTFDPPATATEIDFVFADAGTAAAR